MPQIINTNIASLNAQRNLNASQGAANTALERLSSGLRINSAKDDAAGLAISTRFDSQVTGINQAIRNANDGISLAQTTEGALDEITNNLQRIRELAVQSANASNSLSDRQALNQEVEQRIEEVNRIASQTSFNGLKVLDGTFGDQAFQVGANSGETIVLNGLDSRASELGATIYQTTGLSETRLGSGEAGTTELDISSLDFTAGAVTVAGSVGAANISNASGTYSGATAKEDFAAALQTEIQKEASLAEATVSVSDDGSSLIISNPTATAADASFTVTDATTGTTSGTVTANTQSVAAGTTGNIDTSGPFDYGSTSITGAVTVGGTDYPLDVSGITDKASAASAIQTTIQDASGINRNDVTVTYDSTDDEFDIVVAGGGSAFDFDLSLDDGTGTASGTVTASTQSVAAGGTGNIDTSGPFDYGSTSITGAVTVGGTDYPLDVSGITDKASAASAIQTTIQDASGINRNDVTVTYDSTDDEFDIVVAGGGSAFDFDLSLDDGTGTAANTTGGAISTLAAAEKISLADKFEAGETVSFTLDVAGQPIDIADAGSLRDVTAQINSKTKDTGISAFLNSAGDEIVFASAKGENFEVAMSTDVNSDGTNEVDIDIDTATEPNTSVSLKNLDISTTEGSSQALIALDFAIDQVNSLRSELGAVQNRFESTIANLATTSENLSASNSRIRDADFAAESAELARTQVLQQAGLSVLSQANARPQQVLQLLQG